MSAERNQNHRETDLQYQLTDCEAERDRYRKLLDQWIEYRFCCADTPSKEKLDRMLREVEDATMLALGMTTP